MTFVPLLARLSQDATNLSSINQFEHDERLPKLMNVKKTKLCGITCSFERLGIQSAKA
jgi:hypothetical protein